MKFITFLLLVMLVISAGCNEADRMVSPMDTTVETEPTEATGNEVMDIHNLDLSLFEIQGSTIDKDGTIHFIPSTAFEPLIGTPITARGEVDINYPTWISIVVKRHPSSSLSVICDFNEEITPPVKGLYITVQGQLAGGISENDPETGWGGSISLSACSITEGHGDEVLDINAMDLSVLQIEGATYDKDDNIVELIKSAAVKQMLGIRMTAIGEVIKTLGHNQAEVFIENRWRDYYSSVVRCEFADGVTLPEIGTSVTIQGEFQDGWVRNGPAETGHWEWYTAIFLTNCQLVE